MSEIQEGLGESDCPDYQIRTLKMFSGAFTFVILSLILSLFNDKNILLIDIFIVIMIFIGAARWRSE